MPSLRWSWLLGSVALGGLVHCVGDDPVGSGGGDGPSDASARSDATVAPDGGGPPTTTPLGAITQIVAGEAFTCVLGASGQVRCWGSNTQGQLGQGRPDALRADVSTTSTIQFGTSSKVVELAAAYETACARFADLSVRCWGANGAGERGSGDALPMGRAPADMAALVPVDLGPDRAADRIVAGTRHFCVVVHGTGALLCWGSGKDNTGHTGWLGTASGDTIGDQNGEMGAALVPVAVAEKTVGVALGFTSTCALSDTGNVRCFGTGRGGQLGNGDADAGPDVTDAAAATVTASGVTALFGHGPAYAAQLVDAGVITWGDNAKGRLGLGLPDGVDRNAPVALPAKATILAVSSASSHRCVVLVGGDLYCAGSGEFGKLGTGAVANVGTTPETSFASLVTPVRTGVAQVALGGDHTCALLQSGGVVCWGRNAAGQLGTGNGLDLGGNATTAANVLPTITLD